MSEASTRARRRAFSCFARSSVDRPAGIGVPADADDAAKVSGAADGAAARGAAAAAGFATGAGRSSAATAGSDIASEVSMPGSASRAIDGDAGLSPNGGGDPKRVGALARSNSGSAGGRFLAFSNGRSTSIPDCSAVAGSGSDFSPKPRSNGAGSSSGGGGGGVDRGAGALGDEAGELNDGAGGLGGGMSSKS